MKIFKKLTLKDLKFNKFKNIDHKFYLDKLVLIVLIYIIIRYSLDFKIIYPDFILDIYDEPLFKMILYVSLFVVANYNIFYGLLYFILLVFMEFDYRLFYKDN